MRSRSCCGVSGSHGLAGCKRGLQDADDATVGGAGSAAGGPGDAGVLKSGW